MLRVHIPRPPRGSFLEELSARLEGVRLVDAAPYDVLVEGAPERALAAGCSAIVIPYAGVPGKTRKLAVELDAALYNLHHNAAPTAEMAMALLLAVAKRIVPYDRALRAGDWRPRYGETHNTLLFGKTAVVLGHGAIGRRVAAACEGFGMEVLAVRRRDGAALEELLPRADALMVCLPWTDETEGLIGAAQLALLPDGALLVNVARGPIVDEQALYDALRSGRIAAGLDVWYDYPKEPEDRAHQPPSSLPFHELKNVVMSPHHGGLTDGVEALRAQHLAELLNALARGEEPDSRVDLKRGY